MKIFKSPEARILNRIDGIEEWLSQQSIDVKEEQRHINENSIERLYWHYGYMMALKDALRLLEENG